VGSAVDGRGGQIDCALNSADAKGLRPAGYHGGRLQRWDLTPGHLDSMES
jgi:hypothetical protein